MGTTDVLAILGLIVLVGASLSSGSLSLSDSKKGGSVRHNKTKSHKRKSGTKRKH